LVFAVLAGGLLGLADGIGACALLALPYVLLFIFGKGGAGDAKLMGAIGAWVGLSDGVVVLFCVAIVGGVLGIAKIVSQGRIGFVLINVLCWLYALVNYMIRYVIRRKRDAAESYASQYAYAQRLSGLNIPYGVAIFVGVCVAGGYVLLCK
jgi:Flp pilus assembly protein protease CpaA